MRLNKENRMQISDLAASLGITSRTIRLYEKIGLVEPPKRTEGGVRYYEHDDLLRFRFVLRLKTLGLTLDEMKELAELYHREDHVTDKIMPRLLELLDTHLASIRDKISTLQRLENDISDYRVRLADRYQLGA